MLTSSEFHEWGWVAKLMRRGVEYLDELYPKQTARLGAQAHLQHFYGEFGFVTDSDVYMEDGIPHVEMVRKGDEVTGDEQEEGGND